MKALSNFFSVKNLHLAWTLILITGFVCCKWRIFFWKAKDIFSPKKTFALIAAENICNWLWKENFLFDFLFSIFTSLPLSFCLCLLTFFLSIELSTISLFLQYQSFFKRYEVKNDDFSYLTETFFCQILINFTLDFSFHQTVKVFFHSPKLKL